MEPKQALNVMAVNNNWREAVTNWFFFKSLFLKDIYLSYGLGLKSCQHGQPLVWIIFAHLKLIFKNQKILLSGVLYLLLRTGGQWQYLITISAAGSIISDRIFSSGNISLFEGLILCFCLKLAFEILYQLWLKEFLPQDLLTGISQSPPLKIFRQKFEWFLFLYQKRTLQRNSFRFFISKNDDY